MLVRDPEKTTVYDLHSALGLGFGNIAAADGEEAWRKRLAQQAPDKKLTAKERAAQEEDDKLRKITSVNIQLK